MASSKSLNRRRVASLRFSDHTLTHTFVSSENEQKVAELTIDLQQACGGIQVRMDFTIQISDCHADCTLQILTITGSKGSTRDAEERAAVAREVDKADPGGEIRIKSLGQPRNYSSSIPPSTVPHIHYLRQNLTVVELSKISELKHLEAQAAADTQRLSHQLNAVRNKFLADIAKEEALEIERQEHLARIKLHLQSLCSCEGVKDFTQA